ncbi:pollen-specific leucine-rich repeat extensin-like protein 4 [Iris pallida]|uniref:Pollen-specific leucine-rich repeat extensin-like protein 4 n=1 Tax=Iris pallida TaxID=29817 RepID=A0AAX6FRK0_IRIPA|nr:pollen-specific leucine-rich repeat extensin-like protein 4 [Iris pallida]
MLAALVVVYEDEGGVGGGFRWWQKFGVSSSTGKEMVVMEATSLDPDLVMRELADGAGLGSRQG